MTAPTVFLSPFFNEYNDLNDLPNNGGSVEFFLTETTTPASVYADHTGTVANTNPVIFDSQGYPVSPIWLDIANYYDAVVKDANGNTVYQLNHIGLDPLAPVTTNPSLTVWIDTLVDSTFSGGNFVIAGIWDVTLSAGRRLKFTYGAGQTGYGTVKSASYDAINNETTVALLRDGTSSTINDTGRVYYSVLDSINVAVPAINYYAVNTGTSDVIVANLDPAVLAQTGVIIIIKCPATNSTTTPTLSANGQTAKTIVSVSGTALSASAIPVYAQFMFDSVADKYILLNQNNASQDAKWEALPVGYTQPFIQAAMGSSISTWLANHPNWARVTNSLVADIEGRVIAVSSAAHTAGTQYGSDDAIVVSHTHTGTTAAHAHAGSSGGSHSHGINDPGHSHTVYAPVANPTTAFAGTAAVGAWLGTGTTDPATTGITIQSATPSISIAAEAPALNIVATGSSETNANIQRTQYLDWIYKAT